MAFVQGEKQICNARAGLIRGGAGVGVVRSRNDGYVYVLEHNNEQFKIGKAAVWVTRVKQLKIQLPFKVTLAYAFQTEDCARDEKLLHQRFATKRLNGEWFSLDLDDFGFIAEFCNYSGFYELQNGSITPDPFAYENKTAAEIEAEEARWQRMDDERWAEDDFLDLASAYTEIDDINQEREDERLYEEYQDELEEEARIAEEERELTRQYEDEEQEQYEEEQRYAEYCAKLQEEHRREQEEEDVWLEEWICKQAEGDIE